MPNCGGIRKAGLPAAGCVSPGKLAVNNMSSTLALNSSYSLFTSDESDLFSLRFTKEVGLLGVSGIS